MEAKDLHRYLQFKYKVSTKAEKLSVIRVFEDAGVPIADNLFNMLHKNAPAYPRDYPWLGFKNGRLEHSDWMLGYGYSAGFLLRNEEEILGSCTQPVEISAESLLGMI